MTLLKQTENSVSGEDGTALAILCKSSAASPPRRVQSTWGGARNTASRQSDSIHSEKAVALVEAAQRAMVIGLPFNRHLTVHWAKAGLTDRQAAAATGRLSKLIRDWARKLGGEVAYAWLRENGPGKGSHSHILLHIPDGLKLSLSRRWYRRVTGWTGRVPRFAVKTVCIGGTARAGLSSSDWYQANLAALLAYLLKGSDEATGKELGLAKWSEGGRIIGKRISISANLASEHQPEAANNRQGSSAG